MTEPIRTVIETFYHDNPACAIAAKDRSARVYTIEALEQAIAFGYWSGRLTLLEEATNE